VPQVMKTRKGDRRRVVVVNVGVIGANGLGGIPIERAAERMPEFQQRNPNGSLLQPARPLRGEKLMAAVKAYTRARDLVLVELSEDEIATLDQELGKPAPPPPVRDVALGIAKRSKGKPLPVEAESAAEVETPAASGGDEPGEVEKPQRRSSRSGATEPEAETKEATNTKEDED